MCASRRAPSALPTRPLARRRAAVLPPRPCPSARRAAPERASRAAPQTGSRLAEETKRSVNARTGSSEKKVPMTASTPRRVGLGRGAGGAGGAPGMFRRKLSAIGKKSPKRLRKPKASMHIPKTWASRPAHAVELRAARGRRFGSGAHRPAEKHERDAADEARGALGLACLEEEAEGLARADDEHDAGEEEDVAHREQRLVEEQQHAEEEEEHAGARQPDADLCGGRRARVSGAAGGRVGLRRPRRTSGVVHCRAAPSGPLKSLPSEWLERSRCAMPRHDVHSASSASSVTPPS